MRLHVGGLAFGALQKFARGIDGADFELARRLAFDADRTRTALAGTSPMMIVCSPLSIFTLARRVTSAPDRYTVTASTVDVAGTSAANALER